jgi:hypothetical protein
MKMPTLDIDELQDIHPETVLNYLESNGWVKVESKSTQEYLIWKHSIQDDKEAFVLLPLDASVPDFSSRIYDLIKVLGIVEQRPQSSVLDSLKTAKEFAEAKDRDVLNFRLKFKDNSQREVLAGKLGNLLISFQNLLNGIAQFKSGIYSDTGQIQKRVLQQSQISVIGAFEGSFGLRLASAPPRIEQLDAFQKPLIREVLQELFELVKASNDDQLLKETLTKLKKRSASCYRQFLSTLSELETDNAIEWGSPDKELGGSIDFPYTTVLRALQIVKRTVPEETDVFDIHVEWIGGNKRRKIFEVKNIQTGETYNGSIAPSALKYIEVPKMSHYYNVKILEEPELNEATQEITKRFTLLKIEKLIN